MLAMLFSAAPASFLSTFDKFIGLRADTLAEQHGLELAEYSKIGHPEFQRAVAHEQRG